MLFCFLHQCKIGTMLTFLEHKMWEKLGAFIYFFDLKIKNMGFGIILLIVSVWRLNAKKNWSQKYSILGLVWIYFDNKQIQSCNKISRTFNYESNYIRTFNKKQIRVRKRNYLTLLPAYHMTYIWFLLWTKEVNV